MEKNKLLTAFEDRSSRFEKHFNKLRTGTSAHSVHRFRVDIKKLRAILSLVEIVTDGAFKKRNHFQLLGQIYKPAGRLRELQINRSLIKQYDPALTAQYADFLEMELAKAKLHFRTEVENFDSTQFKKENTRLIQKHLQGLNDKSIVLLAKTFIREQLNKVERLIPEATQSKQLHQIRIFLKSISEIARIVLEIDPGALPTSFRDEVMKMAEQIGEWHDLSALINSMQKFVKGKDDEAFEALIGQVKEQSTQQKRRIKKQLEAKFPFGFEE